MKKDASRLSGPLTTRDFTKDSMLSIEPGSLSSTNKELTTVRIGSWTPETAKGKY